MTESTTNRSRRHRSIIPGFGLSMGYTLLYMGILVIIPMGMLVLNSLSMGWRGFWEVIAEERVLAAYRLSFTTAFASACVNLVVGLLVAWTLVRYDFPGRRLLDALVDIPFALPTAVAGISLTALFSANGWIGRALEGWGIGVVNTPAGIVLALVFIGFPFVVRTVQPVLQEIGKDIEEAGMTLGAGRWRIFRTLLLPEIAPALITGFTLAFARSIGEYGSVIFIAGNLPMKTEIAPLLIMAKLDQFDYAGASAIAVAMLAISFVLLLVLNLVQWRQSKQFQHRS